MNEKIQVRQERPFDIKAISTVIEAAFCNQEYSGRNEHLLVEELRKAGALELSLVAELNDDIVGHIAFSPVTINDQSQHWYGLAPVAVLPQFQNKGIGSRLIKEGIEQIKAKGAKGCVLVGEPEYYKRFGFKHFDQLTYQHAPSQYFLIRPFNSDIPSGVVKYHPIFLQFS